MATVVDSYSESNVGNYDHLGAAGYPKVGQSFVGDGGVLDSVKFLMADWRSPTGSVYAKIYSHGGTFGTSSIPIGDPLATSDSYDASSLSDPDGYYLRTFTFSGSNRITFVDGVYYVVTAEYDGGDSDNFIQVGVDNWEPTHAGNYCVYETSWTADNGYGVPVDLVFYVYNECYSSPLPAFRRPT